MGTGAKNVPVPLGAGMRYISTEPQQPVTLQRDSVGLADLVSPVASSWDNGELGQGDGPYDQGSGYLLKALDTQTDMSVHDLMAANTLNLVH